MGLVNIRVLSSPFITIINGNEHCSGRYIANMKVEDILDLMQKKQIEWLNFGNESIKPKSSICKKLFEQWKSLLE